MIYLTTTAIMAKTGKSRQTVMNWIKNGELTVVETSSGRMVTQESWKRFIQNHPQYWREPDTEEKPDIRAVYYQLVEVQRYINEILPQLKELL